MSQTGVLVSEFNSDNINIILQIKKDSLLKILSFGGHHNKTRIQSGFGSSSQKQVCGVQKIKWQTKALNKKVKLRKTPEINPGRIDQIPYDVFKQD